MRPVQQPVLQLAALSTAKAQSSQWLAAQQVGPAVAIVHPAVVPHARDGALAVLRSELGQLTVQLKRDPAQRPDLVVMEKGGCLSEGRCANLLFAVRLTDQGDGAVYYDTPVTLEVLPE